MPQSKRQAKSSSRLLFTAVVVVRNGEEIQHLANKKDAGAWIQHVYGMKRGISIKPIADRGPRPGDAVVYDGDDDFYPRFGVLENRGQRMAVCFSASAFRKGAIVTCSGGPVPLVDPADLVFAGLRNVKFWREHSGRRADNEAGEYTVTVPLWRWGGGGTKSKGT